MADLHARQCRRCRRLYMPTASNNPLCPECVRRVDTAFELVRNYLYENPTAGMDDLLALSEDVTVEYINQWLREGRLLVAKGSRLGVCQRCGKPIDAGRLCESCTDLVSSAYPTPDRINMQSTVTRVGRMHIGHKDK